MEYKYDDPYYRHFDEYKEAFEKFVEFIITASEITDFDQFCKEVEIVNKNNKEELEKVVIALFKQEELGTKQKYIIDFLEKYKKYLDIKLEKDPKEYYSNQFCWYILTTNYTGKSKEFDFIKNKEAENYDKIDKEANKISDKINNNEPLLPSEKLFLENYTLIGAKKDSIGNSLEDIQ